VALHPSWVSQVFVAGLHSPLAQTSPVQQGSLAAPHATQLVPALSHTRPDAHDFLPCGSTQHGPPVAPQAVHVPPTHRLPSVQDAPLQQGLLATPQEGPPNRLLPPQPPPLWQVLPSAQSVPVVMHMPVVSQHC